MPVDGDENVVGRRKLSRRIDRVDEDEAVARLDGERADVLLPVLMPRSPAAQPRCDLEHPDIFPNRT